MFGSIFKLFSKNIAPHAETDKYMVYKQKTKGGKLRVNANVEVPPAFSFLVVVDGKIVDVLSVGRHRINGSTMPGSFERYNLGAADKKGKFKKQFKAHVYYVNLKVFNDFKIDSSSPFHLRAQNFGRVKGYSEGVASVSIRSAEDIVKYLLKHVNVIKPKYAEREISLLIGDVINKYIEKSKLDFSTMLLNTQKINEQLNPSVDDLMYELGVSVQDVKLVSLRLAKRTQKKVNKFLSSGALPESDIVSSQVLANSIGAEKVVDVLADVAQPQAVAVELNSANDVSKHSFDDILNSDNMQSSKPVFNGDYSSSLEYLKNTGFNVKNNKSQNAQELKQDDVNQNIFTPQDLEAMAVKTASEEPKVSEYINRRMSDAALINKSLEIKGNDTYVTPTNINADKVLSSTDSDKKQCKYCSATINKHDKFCPKCGFKQLD